MKNILLAISIVFSLFAFAGEKSVTPADYPDADAVLVESLEDTEYKSDGTYTSRGFQRVKILTEKGKRDESELVLHYNSRFMKSEITFVKVKNAAGEVRDVDISATSKVIVDNSSANENIYDPMSRKLVCTVPGLEVGDELVYETLTTVFASRIEDNFYDSSVMEWSTPILHQRVRVVCPAELPVKKVKIAYPKGEVKFSERDLEDGRHEMVWETAGEMEQVFPEPDMPPLYTLVQCLRVSTVETWQDISSWYWRISLPHLEKTNVAISNKVAEIGRDLPKLYKWVAQEVRYMGLTMEDKAPGYAPHDVSITFDNRYGVCRDKAALLVAMLRIAGFEAYPVLIHAGAKMDKDVPSPYFNHAIVAVALPEGGVGELGLGEDAVTGGGKYVLMDPTDESSRDLLPSYLSNKSFIVARPDGEDLLTSAVPDAEANSLKIYQKGTLEKDGSLLMQGHAIFNGINDNVYRNALLRRREDARKKLFARILANLAPGADLLDVKIYPLDLQNTAEPLKVDLLYRVPDALVRGDARLELSPVCLSRVLGSANWLLEGKTSLEKRVFPLVVDSTACVEEEISLTMDDTAGEAVRLPEDVDIEGAYAYSRHCTYDDGKFELKRRLAVNAVEFSPEEYDALRESAKEIEKRERERPVFARNDAAGANARTLLSRSIVNVASPRDWVSTNTVVRKILSYDGKKKFSELAYSFNPSWKNVDVVSASVRTQDGRVFEAGEREKNVFDAAWAATAPRYAPSKQLVVNIPGVEVGSEVSFTVVTSVTNAPAEFYGAWNFDSYEPVDKIELVLNGEKFVRTNVKMLESEPLAADGALWRDMLVVSSNDFAAAARRLAPAAKVAAYRVKGPWGDSVESIRDWMRKNVRIAGPSLYETPIENQMTPPDVVIKEGYASRLDYIRTMCSLMLGAGLDAEVVFASLDSFKTAEVQRMDMFDKPNIRAFAYPLCKVVERSGGFWSFLCFGGVEMTSFIGTENEYAPPGATDFAYSHYFDADGRFGSIEDFLPTFKDSSLTIYLRENGAADIDVVEKLYGSLVGEFRKKYAELLPEDRARHYQELIGELAQGASATRELETDVEGYPATRKYSVYIENFAVKSASDALTVVVPEFYEELFPLANTTRQTPIEVGRADPAVTTVKVVFPEGYAKLEHLPAPYIVADPSDPQNAQWWQMEVSSAMEDGRLAVTMTRRRFERATTWHPAGVAPLLREYSRHARSRAERSITARTTND